MASFTLVTRDRQFQMERVATLRELLARRLISPEDRVVPTGTSEELTVTEALEREEAGLPLVDGSGEGLEELFASDPSPVSGGVGGARGGADPWRAWDTDESVEVDDLVSQLLDAVGGGAEPPTAPPVEEADEADTDLWLTQLSQRQGEAPPEPVEPDDAIPDIPEASIEVLADIPQMEHSRPEPRGLGAGRGRAADPGPSTGADAPQPTPEGARPAMSGSYPAVPGGYPAAVDPQSPRSFVEFVQQKRGANTALELHEDRPTVVLGSGERRRPVFFWPAVIGVVVALGALAVYGSVRTGAEREYPTESEVRVRLKDNPGGLEAVIEDVADTDPTEREGGIPAAATDAFRESRLRAEIPGPLKSFRNVETFKDALFTDLANSGVLVREIRVEALVVAPFADEQRQKPEEVNLEIWILAEEGDRGLDATYKTVLVVGHYAAMAHVRVQELVIHVASGDEVWATFLTRGTAASAFWEGKIDIQALDRGMDRVADGDYIDPAPE